MYKHNVLHFTDTFFKTDKKYRIYGSKNNKLFENTVTL